MVPRELVEHEEWRQTCKLVERCAERLHMVEDAARDDRIERAGVVERFERNTTVERAAGRVRGDRQPVIGRCGERGCDPAPVAATNLEDPARRGRKLRKCVLLE